MGILSPLNNPEWLDAFMDAGADQFYCGFYDEDWEQAHGHFCDLNRMSGFGREANSLDFGELLALIAEIARKGAAAYVPFNAPVYTAATLKHQAAYYERLAQAGATGVIISLPEQVGLAAQFGLDPVISTMGGAFNSMIAGYYADLGVRRVILPRDLSLDEIEAIVDATPNLEHEVFLMRNGCVFSDSHCLAMHGHGRGALCHELKMGKKSVYLSPDDESLLNVREFGDVEEAFLETSSAYCGQFHKYACGLCAIWRLANMGIEAYKIVGRSDSPEALCQDIEMAATNLAIAGDCETQGQYLSRMLGHPYADTVCVDGLNCYYPEVRYPVQGAITAF